VSIQYLHLFTMAIQFLKFYKCGVLPNRESIIVFFTDKLFNIIHKFKYLKKLGKKYILVH